MTNQSFKPVYWSVLVQEDWQFHIAATEEGLCFVGSQNVSLAELEEWAAYRLPDHTLVRDDGKLLPYAVELIHYLQGRLTAFTVPCRLRGTPFQESVWQALCEIPYGQTRSYSEIADEIGKPAAVRAVGAAIGANPLLITVPCHRVVGKNGALTGYRGGLEMKEKLLRLES